MGPLGGEVGDKWVTNGVVHRAGDRCDGGVGMDGGAGMNGGVGHGW